MSTTTVLPVLMRLRASDRVPVHFIEWGFWILPEKIVVYGVVVVTSGALFCKQG